MKPAVKYVSHDITDPNAPIGWQCGDPGCPDHGLPSPGSTPEQTHSREYNRGWADGQAAGLDACQPVIDKLQSDLARLLKAAEEMDDGISEHSWAIVAAHAALEGTGQ